MLQIDPKKRITIQQLCKHPWITAEFLNPVSFIHKTNVRNISNFQLSINILIF